MTIEILCKAPVQDFAKDLPKGIDVPDVEGRGQTLSLKAKEGYIFGSSSLHKCLDRIFDDQATQALAVVNVDREVITNPVVSIGENRNLLNKFIDPNLARYCIRRKQSKQKYNLVALKTPMLFASRSARAATERNFMRNDL